MLSLNKQILVSVCILSLFLYVFIFAQSPVTPNPSIEAQKLLSFLYEISGRHTLSGQHAAPLLGSTPLARMHKQVGVYPAVFGQDFGFSSPGSWDGINFRQRIVDEAIRRHHEGFIITLMWHAVPPTEEEPVEFRLSIQGDLTEKEWQDLITPGTHIHECWKSQVDVIAFFLKQLKYTDVPVLWRPYHEMNGGWFWWGHKKGEDGYKKLYRMLFKRLVHFHKLNNLLWVYNANEIKEGVHPYEVYYPGDDVVDILASDVYTEGFNQSNYDALLKLAGTRPVALGEVGVPPSLEILAKQPRWIWYMRWSDTFHDWENYKTFWDMLTSDKVLTYEELPWVKQKNVKIHFPVLK